MPQRFQTHFLQFHSLWYYTIAFFFSISAVFCTLSDIVFGREDPLGLNYTVLLLFPYKTVLLDIKQITGSLNESSLMVYKRKSVSCFGSLLGLFFFPSCFYGDYI